MAIPILRNWKDYYESFDEGLGSSYERIVLNLKMLSICQKYDVKNLLESPAFGFTGISGINSVYLAQQNIEVELIDHDEQRLNLIRKTWDLLDLKANFHFSHDYHKLDFPDNNFDLSWNFSALWFVKDLSVFLKELTRVTRKVIVLCVPNRTGIGYISQKFLGKKDLKELLTEEFIIPKNFIREIKRYGWTLVESNYIDNPPWPDIGMHKEKFLKALGLSFLVKEQERDPLCILDFYTGKKPDFQNDMLKHYWLEKIAPKFFKKFWSHHRYYVFIKN